MKWKFKKLCFRRLDGNPLNCDCDIAWLSTMAQESKNKSLQVEKDFHTLFKLCFNLHFHII